MCEKVISHHSRICKLCDLAFIAWPLCIILQSECVMCVFVCVSIVTICYSRVTQSSYSSFIDNIYPMLSFSYKWDMQQTQKTYFFSISMLLQIGHLTNNIFSGVGVRIEDSQRNAACLNASVCKLHRAWSFQSDRKKFPCVFIRPLLHRPATSIAFYSNSSYNMRLMHQK